jgi:GTPase
VTIGDVTFDFEPTGGVDEAEYAPTRRGFDVRIDSPSRIRAQERLAAKKARRTSYDDERDARDDEG